ncbi:MULTISPECIES: S8 family serine peptidase [Actinoplanes]|uniref:S8 family serine peptidase n=1 Tax=Actinoplanes TaxID=1865 RepID=UPI000A8547F9|nr:MULTISPECIES: S8 family serine peptidase [Actinoplanes]GLY01604.1 hypothetical protein Acsp01_19830 [Actinoplanes sp. NBRC 101535]
MSRRLSRALAGVAVSALVAVPVVPLSAGPALAAPGDNCAEAGELESAAPWPRTTLALDQVHAFSQGGGVTVAVLSTGVDANQEQLRGRVLAGFDAVRGTGAANTDCSGTGTQIAGTVAAQPVSGNGVIGVAPYARIQPVRVVADNPLSTAPAEAAPLVRGVTWAAGAGAADVIVIGEPVYQKSAALENAVTAAVAKGIIVVASVGDTETAGSLDAVPYPAGFGNVLGVGAVGIDGTILSGSPSGDYVDLVAPGAEVPTLQRGSGLVAASSSGIAAGVTAGVVAVARSKRGDLLPAEIVRTILAGASPAPLTGQYGAGVVNPYAALTEQIVAPSARALPEVAPARMPDTSDADRRSALALGGAGVLLFVVVVVLIGTAAMRRRRTWRPVLTPPLPVVEEKIEPGPPVELLTDLSGTGRG